MCAIHGKNFCGSAQDALNLLLRNCLRVIALDQVTDFLFFLCKVLISLGIGACTYIFCGSELSGLKLNSEIAPTVVVMIGSYLCTCVFFRVYSMAVETLFLCFRKLTLRV
jgi:solute carrier family 44 (choline transporter-like protein), member 2/4/5